MGTSILQNRYRMSPHRLSGEASVSVVIPCYNYARFLRYSVSSVLAQTDVRVDVLIVDDSSTDGSAEVAQALAAGDSRVRAVCHDTNAGHIKTYNEGLSRVDGDYVVLLSADDLLSPGSLSRSVALLEAVPSVGFVYGFSPEFRDQPPKARTKPSSWSVWRGHAWVEECCRRGKTFVFTPEVVMRREVMQELHGYKAGLPHSADMELWMRAATRSDVGRVNGVDQAFYRVHGRNMHLTDFAGTLTDIRERLRTFDVFFSSDEARALSNLEELGYQSRRAIGQEALAIALRLVDLADTRGENPADYAVLAAATWPAIRQTRQWKTFARRSEGSSIGGTRYIARRLRQVRRDVAGRISWRRWRHVGI